MEKRVPKHLRHQTHDKDALPLEVSVGVQTLPITKSSTMEVKTKKPKFVPSEISQSKGSKYTEPQNSHRAEKKPVVNPK